MLEDATLKEQFSPWIGRKFRSEDVIDTRLVNHFLTTLAPFHASRSTVPPGIFWCLGPAVLPSTLLGDDGHPSTGLLIPDIPFPRRMWAGGELVFHGEFSPDRIIVKISTIADIVFKTGSTGRLGFVTMRHDYFEGDRLVLEERQDIVFRELATHSAFVANEFPTQSIEPKLDRWVVNTDPVLLFRYSALTMNGHRIHYDHVYATEVECYADLVVHGPLQATLMLTLATEKLGHLPKRFNYRGLTPLTCGSAIAVDVQETEGGYLETSITSEHGVRTMTANVER